MMAETRICNVCGEDWDDTGEQECLFCGSADTHIKDIDVKEIFAAIRQMSNYFRYNSLNFQYEKMADYVRELEILLPENEK